LSKIGSAGNTGGGVRSDCFVTLEITGQESGLDIDLKSKVSALYGDSIREAAAAILAHFELGNAKLLIDDSGSLPYVQAARIEAAVRQCVDTDEEYLPKLIPQNQYRSSRNRHRRSRLYLPGNTPKLMLNAGIHKPDGIILDLEDSVAPAKKSEARMLVRNALRQVDFYGAERMVRINQLPLGLEDLRYVVPHNVHVILIPKCETANQVQQVDETIAEINQRRGGDQIEETRVYLMPIIESALGVVNAYEIAAASDNVVALAIGLEDYTADLGASRTKEGRESFFARSQIVNAARAAGVQPIDSVFSDVDDMAALRDVALESKAMGFDGMGCIHPRQIKVIHEAFAPDREEVEKAQTIVLAYDEALEKGVGVIAIGSKMIDVPIVKRAHRTIDLAILSGRLPANWKEHHDH
jgi:citrate lyase subunit beta/citryl-CoA lyase